MPYSWKLLYNRPLIKDTPESLETQKKLLEKFNKTFCLLKSGKKSHVIHSCYTTLQEVHDAIANLSGKDVEQFCRLLKTDGGESECNLPSFLPILPWSAISKKKLSSAFRAANKIYWRKPTKKERQRFQLLLDCSAGFGSGETVLLNKQTEVEALKEFAAFIENHYRSERNKGLETFYAEDLPVTLTLLTKQILELALTNGASVEEKARIARNELVVVLGKVQKALDATTPLEKIKKLQASAQEDSSDSKE